MEMGETVAEAEEAGALRGETWAEPGPPPPPPLDEGEGPFCWWWGPDRSGVGGLLLERDREERAKSLALTARRWSRLCTRRSTESSKSTFSSFSWWREESREATAKNTESLVTFIKIIIPWTYCQSGWPAP